MMPVIRISDEVFGRLQQYATPFVDTPASVIERLLNAYEAKQKDTSGGQKPATKSATEYWFVNVGESKFRNWDDCVRYGFLAAGWGPQFSDPLLNLEVGCQVFAYLKGYGYVGYGEVTSEACPAEQFTPHGYDKPLLQLPLAATEMGHSPGDHDNCEWVVGVKWHKALDRDDAKTYSGIFAGRNIVCRLRNQPKTVTFLAHEFEVSGDDAR